MSMNLDALENELVRAARGKLFLDNFFADTATLGLKVDRSLDFTDCFLAEEIIGADDSPSSASGLSRDTWESTPNDDNQRRIIWLCEPLRLSAPERFTGTLQYNCTGKDLTSQNINAFIHYAYLQSQKDLLFVDIQGSRGRLSDGTIGTILFDVMTHSLDGQTGVGDHGIESLQEYEAMHKCNKICSTIIQALKDCEDSVEQQ